MTILFTILIIAGFLIIGYLVYKARMMGTMSSPIQKQPEPVCIHEYPSVGIQICKHCQKPRIYQPKNVFEMIFKRL